MVLRIYNNFRKKTLVIANLLEHPFDCDVVRISSVRVERYTHNHTKFTSNLTRKTRRSCSIYHVDES